MVTDQEIKQNRDAKNLFRKQLNNFLTYYW